MNPIIEIFHEYWNDPENTAEHENDIALAADQVRMSWVEEPASHEYYPESVRIGAAEYLDDVIRRNSRGV